MRIDIASVLVSDQSKALAFYTNVLGFVREQDIPLGEARWLTVVSPEAMDGVELLLEPMNQAAQTYQTALFEQGITATAFAVDDLAREYERLAGRGVRFVGPPHEAGDVLTAVLDDTCGNLI